MFALLSVLHVTATAQDATNGAAVPGSAEPPVGERARWIYTRMIAPCCWTQTLDVHDSPVSTELRREIAVRVANGESSEAIEDDMASRYGERIRAVPSGEDPRMWIVALVGVGMLLSAVALVQLAKRYIKRAAPETPDLAVDVTQERDRYDDALDAEVARLDA